jgi:penicillin-binding protein 2
VERQGETNLGARLGLVVEQLDQRGRVKSSLQQQTAASGGDVTLTIDPRVQRAAEILLDESLRRRLPSGNDQLDRAAGGAVVVLDVHTGDVLVAASAPRFDPNAFVRGESSRIGDWLNDPATPMLDRAIQMALPPGSVFKIVTAATILDAGVNPRAPVDCLGYLHQPDALRCAVFRRTGVGHGPVTLPEALARSCNVYFFHHAEQLGAMSLVDWAKRFGLGSRSGIELAGESAGQLPSLELIEKSPAESRPMSIGQSTITTTPLQMARVAAAIANGGRLVTPRMIERDEPVKSDTQELARIDTIVGLNSDVLAAIRSGMLQAVADEQGTAHATVELSDVAIAGKTGTAQAGGDRPDHAWFIGYAPAEHPRVAFAVALQYAGDGAIAAGPIARHLVAQMHELGYFTTRPAGRAARDNNRPR